MIDSLNTMDCSEYRPNILIAQSNEGYLNRLAKESDLSDKYDYVVATSGTSVIDNINTHCFDAVVLGLKFPDITGATLAYLIHDFDPLISLAFLTSYNSNILIAAAESLHCAFWNKEEESKDFPALCEKIYQLGMEMPCKNMERTVNRNYSKIRRETYNSYSKLNIPSGIAEVIQSRGI